MRRGDLYWHFKSNAWAYRAGVMVVVTVLVFFSCRKKTDQMRVENAERVKNWPLVEATILKSEVSLVNMSDDVSFKARYYATLELEYYFEDRLVRSVILGDWDHPHPLKGEKVFQVGKQIPLRVNPDDPGKASLIELTGRL